MTSQTDSQQMQVISKQWDNTDFCHNDSCDNTALPLLNLFSFFNN